MSVGRYIKQTLMLLSVVGIISCGEEPGDGGSDGGGGDGDKVPSLSINDVTKFEGDDGITIFSFPLQLSDAIDEDVKVEFRTEEGTAGVEDDFVAKTGSLIISAGERNLTIEIEVKTDIYKEQDETFTVVITEPSNATLTRSVATGTIRNDDTTIIVTEGGYITPLSYPGYNLFWSDEFDENEIDLSSWGYDLGNSGWGNQELQNYTNLPKNSYLSSGNLVIEAKKESDGSYTSARMLTQDKVEFALGRVDVRAKLPEGQGIWPAIWMLGANFSEIGWPACGEIDIMELVGHEPNKVHGTAHWGPQGGNNRSAGSSTTDLDGFQDDYHVFSIIWDINKVEWYVDDSLIHSISPQTTSGQAYPFNEPFFLIMNVAVGGQWPGYPDATTQFPQLMIVDYVRVFQRN